MSIDGHGSEYGEALEETGITRQDANRWQLEAALPEEQFDQFIAETKAKAEELTSKGVLALAELERFCPRCYGIEMQRREVEDLRRRRKAHRDDVSTEEIRKAQAKARQMLDAHPKCRRCGVLFGGEHLFHDTGWRICQACRWEQKGKD